MRGVVALAAVLLAALPCAASGDATGEPSREDGIRTRGDAYYHLMRARLAMAAGRSSEALRELREATALEPDSARLHAEAARLLFVLGRRQDAESMALRAVEIRPDDAEATRVLADLAAARALGRDEDPKSRDEAIRLYQRVIDLAGEPEEDVFSILTRLKLQAGDAEGAVEAAREFYGRRPGDASAARLLSQVLLHLGRSRDALALLAEFLRSNPEARELLPMAAELARREGAWDALILATSRMIEDDPGDVLARSLRGEAFLRSGRAPRAIVDLEVVVGAMPRESGFRAELAAAYQASGRYADAEELARGLSAEYAGSALYPTLLGDVRSHRRDSEGAIEAWEEAIERLGDAGEAARIDEMLSRIAAEKLARDDLAGAAAALDRARGQDSPDVLGLRAALALARDDAREARNLASRIRNAGEAGAAAVIEGESFAADGQIGRARERFVRAAELLGPTVRARGAAVMVEAGASDEALRLVREWVDAEPADPAGRFQLAVLLDRLGDAADAERALRETLGLDPDHAEASNYLAYAMALRGSSLDEALALVRGALEVDPWNPAYLDTLGWVLFRSGRFAEAVEPLERAARELPRDPTILDHLGDAYDRVGRRDEARETWRRALREGPEDPDAIRAKIERAGESSRSRSDR